MFSPAYVNSRLAVLAATAGESADPAHKVVAVDDLRHCVLEGQRTREQSGMLCDQLLYGEHGVQAVPLPTIFRRWVQSESYGGVRGMVLDLLSSLCRHPPTRDALTAGHCQALMALALFVIRAAEASKVREKGFQLMESLLLIHRIPWDKPEGGGGGGGEEGDHITPKAIIDVSEHSRSSTHTPQFTPVAGACADMAAFLCSFSFCPVLCSSAAFQSVL